MLTEEEFVKEERRFGRKLHFHDEVWWVEARRGYCKPVMEFNAFPRGAAKPRARESFLGYSHQVADPKDANRFLEYLILDGEDLHLYHMNKLRPEKRKRIRKGFRCCEVRLIQDLLPLLGAIKDINISQALRQGRTDITPSYFAAHEEEWRREKLTEFAHRGITWWGAFQGETLLAYVVTIGAGDTLHFKARKTHTDSMHLCPSDALYYSVIEAAAREGGCARIVDGGPGSASLDNFKTQYLMRRVPVPYFTSGMWLFSAATAALDLTRKLTAARQGRSGTP
jgi:hypothetical protein